MDAIILFVLVLGLLFLEVPVAVSLGLSSILVIAFFSDDSMSSVALQLFTASQNYTLLAIPFFILASAFMSTGGVARRIIRFAIAIVGHFRSGLAMASVLACMLFAALSGSSPSAPSPSPACARSATPRSSLWRHRQCRYARNPDPASIVMVVYSAATDVSVGRMFLVGVVPGIVAGLMPMLAIYFMARVKGLPAEPWKGFMEIIEGGKEAGWGLFLIIIILGGIYGGVFTPTEAAAVYAFFIALFIYRDMGPMKDVPWVSEDDSKKARVGFSASVYGAAFFFVWMILSFFATAKTGTVTVAGRAQLGLLLSLVIAALYVPWRGQVGVHHTPAFLLAGLPIWGRNLVLMGRNSLAVFFNEDTRRVMMDASKTTIMLMFIIVNALLFAHVLTGERIPQHITELMVDAGFTWFTFLIAVNVLLLLGGQFMEPSCLLLIVAPVVFPIAMELGVDPVHLGIIMVVNMEIGMITPPIGLNLLVTSGITGMSFAQVVKASTTIRYRAVRLPDPGDLSAGAVYHAALCAHGAGDRHTLGVRALRRPLPLRRKQQCG